MDRWILTIAAALITLSTFGQGAHKNLLNGDKLYGFGKNADAEKEYRKADTESPGLKPSYNLGNTLMNQERYDEAIKKYRDALGKASKPEEKSATLHNLGNAYYRKKQYKESIDAYKQSLAIDPGDMQTKENLAIARRELQKQMKQQQQQNQNEDQQQNKDQNNHQGQDENRQQNEQQQSQNQKNDNQSGNSKQQMTREDARNLLNFIEDQDKKIGQKQRRKEQGTRSKGKDW